MMSYTYTLEWRKVLATDSEFVLNNKWKIIWSVNFYLGLAFLSPTGYKRFKLMMKYAHLKSFLLAKASKVV